jgi:Tfp pilus assembly protein PilV
MFVISWGLLAMLPFLVQSARAVGFALERQKATALVSRAVEQVRDVVGTPARAQGIAAGGPSYTFGPSWTPPAGETLLTSANPDAALTQIGPSGTPAITVRLYVTSRSGDLGSTRWLTCVATWTSANAGTHAQQVSTRSLLYLEGLT